MISKIDKITCNINTYLDKRLEKHFPTKEDAFATLLFDCRELWLIEDINTAKEAIGYFYYRMLWFKKVTGVEDPLVYIRINEPSTLPIHEVNLDILEHISNIYRHTNRGKLISSYTVLLVHLDELAIKHGTTLTECVEFAYEELFQNE